MTVTTSDDVAEVSAPASLRGEIRLPGDKSITHRAILLNALAEGEARVSQAGLGGDCLRTVECLRSIGVEIQFLSDTDLRVRSFGIDGMREPDKVLDCGNSGTTMRLLLGLVASLDAFSVLSGDGSLRGRPMSRVANPLRLMGAEIYGRNGGENAPLAVKGGRLTGIEVELPVASAQAKSALLLAGMTASGETTIRQPALSRNHTELMLHVTGRPNRRNRADFDNRGRTASGSNRRSSAPRRFIGGVLAGGWGCSSAGRTHNVGGVDKSHPKRRD